MLELTHILTVCWYIVEICLGVGFIIFVHELGHFAVAKLCGVKCEKFYLGFDIGGWKFCKFRWGETEYGIGILPLGGYVKMLGQEDNPAKLKEEIERAKLARPAEKSSPDGKTPENELRTENPQAATDFDLAQAEKSLYDPRSYLAKSVPKRMAIISAGVIMNVIFAFLMAALAYSIGVEQATCMVGEIFPGEAAWRAGLQPGDRIVKVAGNKIGRFNDLHKYIQVGDISNGVSIVVERPGEKQPLKFVLHPDRFNLAPSVGITGSDNLNFVKTEDDMPPVFPGSAAAEAKPPLRGGDRIASINGEKIRSYRQLQAYLANNPGKSLEMTVDCTIPGEGGAPAISQPSLVTIPPQPMRTLGLVMKMGDISAVQAGSPAEKAGIRPGDRILKIDGEPPGDPLRLPDLIRKEVGKTIVLTIEREGKSRDVPVALRNTDAYWPSDKLITAAIETERENFPCTIPQLGIAYRVGNKIERVLPGSPADKAGIRAGESIRQVTFSPPKTTKSKAENSDQITFSLDLSKKNENWPLVFLTMQLLPPDTQIELALDKDRTAKLQTADATDWFNPDRGFLLEADTYFQKADSLGEALRLGANETWDSLTMVVKILRKIGTRQVSPKALGGPGTIFVAAYQRAKLGFAPFLLFLTLLSANLAVLNVLPIPLLDGGHLVFLTYEGIRGKPADERVQIVLSVIGLILLLGLMIYVIGLDINRFKIWIFGR